MKKLNLLFALCVLLTVGANAQEFKKFKVGLGAGYAIPGGSGAKGGVLFFMEPAYRIQDQLQLGLRMEFAAMARGFSGDFDSEPELSVSTSGSYTLNGQYYFNNNGFRPFVGLGLGLYNLKAAKFDAGDEGDIAIGKDESKFGFYPRIGFDAGHFVLSIDYNIVPKTEYSYEYEFDGQVEKVEFSSKNSYIGIRFGVNIGGGRK